MGRRKIRVGVIGVGCMGGKHAENLAFRIPDAQLIAVADIDSKVAKRAALKYGVKSWYTDYRALLKDSELEAIVISTEVNTHKPMLLDAKGLIDNLSPDNHCFNNTFEFPSQKRRIFAF